MQKLKPKELIVLRMFVAGRRDFEIADAIGTKSITIVYNALIRACRKIRISGTDVAGLKAYLDRLDAPTMNDPAF